MRRSILELFAVLFLMTVVLFPTQLWGVVVGKSGNRIITHPPLSATATELAVKPSVGLLKSKPQVRDVKQTAPPMDLCFPIKVTTVHDGDTCKAIVAFELTVRYDNCWAPELKDELGPKSATRAKEAEGKPGRLYIDLSNVRNLADMLTFGRVVGEVWLDGEAKSESQKQIEAKLASTKKGGSLGE